MKDHCNMEVRCQKGEGICCTSCNRFARCKDACHNHPDLCGLKARPTVVKENTFSGSRFLALRRKAGISRAELAAQLKTKLSRVKQWETGESRPYIKTQVKICSIIGCTLADIQQ